MPAEGPPVGVLLVEASSGWPALTIPRVHLSVLGHLSTAGRALVTAAPGESGRAALAGARVGAHAAGRGDPGATWWVTDAATRFADVVGWRTTGAEDVRRRWQRTQPG